MKLEDLQTPCKPTWCPGCGDFGIWLAVKQALVQLDVPQEEFCFTYGIGCNSHMCNFLHVYGFEGLHGRPIPVAEGIKLANKNLKVLTVAGDGDTYGEGLNHFVTGVRGNHDVTLLVHDNRVYALTTGQASPTSDKGYVSKSTPTGTIEVPVNPLALAISQGGTFVAQGFSADPKQLIELIKAGVQHKGFAVINILQNCSTFNKINTVMWFKEHSKHLEDVQHDPSDKKAALEKAMDHSVLWTGILYQEEGRKSYDEEAPAEKGAKPLTEHDLSKIDLMKTMHQFV